MVTLPTVAMTANVAIEVLRRVNEAFLEDFPEFDTHYKVVEILLHLDGPGRKDRDKADVSRDSSGWYILDDVRLSP